VIKSEKHVGSLMYSSLHRIPCKHVAVASSDRKIFLHTTTHLPLLYFHIRFHAREYDRVATSRRRSRGIEEVASVVYARHEKQEIRTSRYMEYSIKVNLDI
jgi:hypothetical protein